MTDQQRRYSLFSGELSRTLWQRLRRRRARRGAPALTGAARELQDSLVRAAREEDGKRAQRP